MRRFVRPHRPDIGMLITAALVGFALLFALSVTVAALTVSGVSSWLLLGVYGFVVLVLIVAVRLYRVGVYVGDTGVRIRHLWRTRTLAWAAIDEVRSSPARMLGFNTARHAIWVVPHRGRPIETPVQLENEVTETGLRKGNGRLLGPIEYQETLLLLRRRAAAGQT